MSCFIPNYLLIFRMIGRIIAKGLIDHKKLIFNVDFTKPFLKHILCKFI